MNDVSTGTALVTGASTGIGRSTVLALANKGFTVYATARNESSVDDLAGHRIRTARLDVTDEESVRAAVAAAEADGGVIDVLVNNAGYGEMGAIEDVGMERWRSQFETNLLGPVRLAQVALPAMRAAGRGRIINVSSMGGEFTTPLAGAYHASKYALESASDALRFEVAPFGVDVIVIQPAGVRTPLAGKTRDQLADGTGSRYQAAMESLAAQAETMEGSGFGSLAPEQVAKVVAQAAVARRPRTRYKVGSMAHVLPGLRRWLTDRQFDILMRRMLGSG